MTDTPAHTPLRLSAGDETRIMDSKGFPLIDVPCGGMTGRRVKDAEQIAAFIVRACNSHYQLVEAAKAIMPTNLNLADWLPDDATIPLDVPVSELRALAAALSQAGGASE